MIISIESLLGIGFVYLSCSLTLSWRRNIAAARRSGLPYIVSPFSPVFLPWQATHKLWLPLIKLLPRCLWEDWLGVVTPDFTHHTGHDEFDKHGETFLIASPRMILLFTSDAAAIRNISARRDHFPKWTETYAVLRKFGDNVLSSEGATWRMHRKATAASFNEKNAALVFHESIRQAEGLLRLWTTPERMGQVIETLEKDTMRLTLNIIGYVGFGMKMSWPGEEQLAPGSDPNETVAGSSDAPEGYTLSFIDTMEQILEHIFLLLLVPAGLLHRLPFKKAKEAAIAHDDYVKYMEELVDQKQDEARQGDSMDKEPGMDLMGQLVRSMQEAEKSEYKLSGPSLTRDDIIGNAFIMLVAGHETTADAMHFTLIEMATNPATQRRLQRDLDELVGDSKPDTWNYDALLGPLMGSMVGAAMNETLRLIPPVVVVPKEVTPDRDQHLALDGKDYTLPAGTILSLAVSAAHRNPRYWPSEPSKVRPGKNNLGDYEPARWFLKNDTNGKPPKTKTQDADGAVEEDFGGYRGPDTSAELFRPERGSYVPFSDGSRSCLGRRIAQVEVLAALAVIFQHYSVELVTNESDGENEETRYKAAQDRSRKAVDGATSVLTLKLQGNAKVPIRLVKRGNETYASWLQS
ncbi:cytochrome p450 domain-containing protein [Sarocladium implicatum]|nr:cytochrome p450 domain-containing protein [Sarocladium implicatum]